MTRLNPSSILASAVALVVGVSVGACASGAPSSPSPRPTPTTTAEATAVSSPSELPSPPAAIDACAVVTKTDAEHLTGTKVNDGQAGNPAEPSCTYTAPTTGPLGQVQVFIGAGAKKTYDIDVQLKHVFKPVAGVGEEAYEETNAIFFRKGTTWVAIELVRLNDPSENVAPLQEVAKAAVLRLG